MEVPKTYALTYDVWMIPCKIDPKHKTFKPLIKPLGNSHPPPGNRLRKYWTKEEDGTLCQIIKKSGPYNWSSAAKELNIMFHDSLNLRNGKQCRERWFSNLDPKIIRSKWTKAEDHLLYTKHEELGNKWSIIKEFFKGRSESQVKNRWKTLINRKKKINVEEKKKFDKKGIFGAIDYNGSEYSLEDIEVPDKFNGFDEYEPGKFDWDFGVLNERIDENCFYTGEEDQDFLQNEILVEKKIENSGFGLGVKGWNDGFIS